LSDTTVNGVIVKKSEHTEKESVLQNNDNNNRSGDKNQWKFLMKLLIKRDFQSRYKKTFFGMLWSMVSPLVSFLAQAIVFKYLFKRGEHYITYLITGNVVYHYFTDATSQGMHAIGANAGIIAHIKVKKDMFLISKNIACLYNFFLTLIILFAIMLYDGLSFHWTFISLLYPLVCLFFVNLGVGYLLSSLQVFFKDTQYFYGIFTSLLVWFSALFYQIDMFPEKYQHLFFYNPVYPFIHFFRSVIMENTIPDIWHSIFCLAYAVIFMCFGWASYRINDNRFIYYL